MGYWGQVDAFQGVGDMEEEQGGPSRHNKQEIRYIIGSSGEKSRLGRTSSEGGRELIKPVEQGVSTLTLTETNWEA